MERLLKIKERVKNLYADSTDDCMRTWFYPGHVEVVFNYVLEIAKRENIDPTIPALAGLFHDIARANGVFDDPQLMDDSLKTTKDLMQQANYTSAEIDPVCDIIKIHSCRNEPPNTLEGKVMVTADALAHFMTDFYFVLPFYGWYRAAKTFEGYKAWLLEKVERDFNKKIQFNIDKERAKARYQSFLMLFSE